MSSVKSFSIWLKINTDANKQFISTHKHTHTHRCACTYMYMLLIFLPLVFHLVLKYDLSNTAWKGEEIRKNKTKQKKQQKRKQNNKPMWKAKANDSKMGTRCPSSSFSGHFSPLLKGITEENIHLYRLWEMKHMPFQKRNRLTQTCHGFCWL